MKTRLKTPFLGPCFSRKGLLILIFALAIAGPMGFFTGSAVAGSTAFAIHVGSFKKQANAMEIASSARSLGHFSFVQESDDPHGGVWHRVFVGPFPTEQETASTLSQLKKNQLSDYYAIMKLADPPPVSTAKSGGISAPAMEESPLLNNSPLTLSVTTGWSFLPRVNDFLVQQSGATNSRWFIEDHGTGFIGMNANWQFTHNLSAHGSVKTEIFDDIRLYYLELGPKISGDLSGNLKGHLWFGAVYGNFDWDNVPGDFDDSFGWQIGSGLTYQYRNFYLGLEAAYRKIEFDYTPPANAGVTANQTAIDFSGTLVSGSVGYRF